MRQHSLLYPQRLFLVCGMLFGGFAMADTQPDADKTVQAAARALMQEYKIAGLAIATSQHGQQKFYNFGVASKDTQRKVDADTLFEIGSISKTLTATLATYAQASGRLLLSDHPGKYFPQLQGSKLDQVTLMNLGTHTAGGFPLQLPDEVHNNQQLMDYFSSWQPQYAAGTYRTYANPSVGLLGMIAAKSLGVPFEQAMQAQLFVKLGMFSSYLTVPPNKMTSYAQGYDKNDAAVRVNPGMLAAEAYGVKTSASDLIHFVELNMGQVKTHAKLKQAISDTHIGYYQLGPMTQDLIWEQYRLPVNLATLVEGNTGKLTSESTPVIALMPPLAPQQAVWINKTGSTGGFGAYVAFIPSKQLGIVILANRNYPNEARVRLAHQILTALDDAGQH